MNTHRTIIAASLAAAFFAPPAWSANDVQSVVVTAQSRNQLVQDVPMTMQVAVEFRASI